MIGLPTITGRTPAARAILNALVLLLCLQALVFAQTGARAYNIEGVVIDQTGAPVGGAEVSFSSKAFTANRTTDNEGRFIFDAITTDNGTLNVTARGFARIERKWVAGQNNGARVEIVLEPESISEQVTITAARTMTRVSDTAASVVVLSPEVIATTAALTLDDLLRQVPGFSLFRRSGSRTANPTTQGVSLRGVGASGASRAVVLADGIPINDPFGGWVYWGRVPRESINRVEVIQGGASSLYGTDALGGVINFITRDSRASALSLEASYGNQQTPNVSFFTGGRIGQLGATIAAEAFHTDGYILVDERERGLVDTPAGAEHTTLELTLERLLSDSGRVFLRGSIFDEHRENGTPLQLNRTHIRQASLGYDWQSQSAGAFSVRAYGGAQVYDQDFSAIAADRNSETLTRSQRVPARQLGITAQWSRAAGSRQTLVAGLDGRKVRASTDELGFAAGPILTTAFGASASESSIGVFGQDILRITRRWLATVGARFDRWRNYDALATTRPIATPGPVVVGIFDDRTETAFSPRLAMLYRLTDKVSLTASGYRAFRAPTLNELYRGFRVGNVNTLANDKLRAERLTGGEAGASVATLDKRLNVRGTFFWSEITRPIANVTLSVTPTAITRQRRNLGRTRSLGVELETDARITNTFSLSGGYQFVDATVREFPANLALEGLLIPQVARHQLTFQARYTNPSLLFLGLQGRISGSQFDDDQNLLKLDRYFTLDALASRPVRRGVELFAAFENLFNQRYAVGRTPTKTLGPPLLARFGFRLRLGAR